MLRKTWDSFEIDYIKFFNDDHDKWLSEDKEKKDLKINNM